MSSFIYDKPMPVALKWFLAHTFNDIYVLYFGSKKKQLFFQIDDHSDDKVLDKIIGLINKQDILGGWQHADYFYNLNKVKEGDPIETMTLCLNGREGKDNSSDKIVIIQPFDNMIIHSNEIKILPPKKKKINFKEDVNNYEGQNLK